ncbi:phage head closure protein [Pseudovibrio ascidiaceicola]|uniref:phage head closure protein n=1 Tax=Pseudovibrio ascidiaceicola TaxID=285279 RepID=UPI003D367F66
MPRPGSFRDLVIFQREKTTPDGAGGSISSWEDIGGAPYPAQFSPQRGRERVEAGQISSVASGILQIRYNPDLASLSEKDRVLLNGVTYNIRNVEQPDRRQRFLELVIERGVAV